MWIFPTRMKAAAFGVLRTRAHGIFAAQIGIPAADKGFALRIDPVSRGQSFFRVIYANHCNSRIKRIRLYIVDIQVECFGDPHSATMQQDGDQDVPQVQAVFDSRTPLTAWNNKSLEQQVTDLAFWEELDIGMNSCGQTS